jgi:hypothetical protein
MIWGLALFAYLSASPILLVGYILMKNQGTTVDWQRLSGKRMGLWSGSDADKWSHVFFKPRNSMTCPFSAVTALRERKK